jgi:hypothetical protein
MDTTTITIPKIKPPKLDATTKKYTVRLVAVATAILAGVAANDYATVAGAQVETCSKEEIPIVVPKIHTALVAPLFDNKAPKLSDVVAEQVPTVAISKIATVNKLEATGNLPATPGGIYCLKAVALNTKKVAATEPTKIPVKVPTTAAEVETSLISNNYGTAPVVTVEFDSAHPGRLTDQQIYSAVKMGGFKGSAIVTAIAIAKAESAGKSNARCYNVGRGCSPVAVPGVRSTDRGLFQINDKAHPNITASCADDPGCAAVAALKIAHNGKSFTAWSSYKSGSYRKFLSAAMKVAA